MHLYQVHMQEVAHPSILVLCSKVKECCPTLVNLGPWKFSSVERMLALEWHLATQSHTEFKYLLTSDQDALWDTYVQMVYFSLLGSKSSLGIH